LAASGIHSRRRLLRALRDRSSDVRLTAIRALGKIGDPQTVEQLQVMAKRHARSPLIEHEVKEAVGNIRKVQTG
jgi:HEAT repeat protein